MRINKTNEKEYRSDLYECTAECFEIGMKSGRIDAACEFSTQLRQNLERAAEHEDMTEDLAAVLATANVTVKRRTITGVKVNRHRTRSRPSCNAQDEDR